MKNLIYLSTLVALMSCESYSQSAPEIDPVTQKQFADYWYAGVAELTSYELRQARYGEVHDGDAVLIFVTEPFSRSKQVKLDNPAAVGDDAVTVLKLNMTKKFLTGLYPYSMMMSSFVPVSYDRFPDALKVSTTSQEWCGHTFMQLNLAKNDYRVTGFSYFESEGDLEEKVDKALLEDEIWNRIRLNPDQLPTGEIDIVPSTFYLRLRHQDTRPQTATATLTPLGSSDFSGEVHNRYSLQYPDRSLSIYYESNFPFAILGWEEEYRSGGETLKTVAVRKQSILSPYWQKNSKADRALRAELGLE